MFENDAECEHDNVGKFWGKNKSKLLHTEIFKRLAWAVSNIDNTRKKYVKLRGYLVVIFFALHDSIESDDEGDIIMILIQNL